MATYEYIDLCVKAQNTSSEYCVFTFDIVGSKKMSKEVRNIASYKMELLMLKMYNEMSNIEKGENRKILLREDVVPYANRHLVDKKFGMLFEPFIFANTFGFTVYNGSISVSEVLEIFNRLKIELKIDFEFHVNNLCYETNDYGLGGKLFFRGYAIDICSSLNKPLYNKIKVKRHNNSKM